MALTQERMIALISTARRFYNDLDAFKTQTRKLIADLPLQPTHEELLTTIQALQFMLDSFRSAEQDIRLLISEEMHYKQNHRRNQRAAEYARRRRAGLPTTFKGLTSEEAELATSAGLSTKPKTLPRLAKPLDEILSPQTPAPVLDLDAEIEKALTRDAQKGKYGVPLASKSESALLATYKPLPSDTPPDPDDLF